MDLMTAYQPTLWAMGVAGLLLLVQLIVADLVAIRSGHRAGTPVPVDFRSFLFRAARAHANTNESIAAFALLAAAGILSAASPLWLNGLAWAYVACRVGHMASYYANRKAARSTAFGLSLLALLGMFAVSAAAWFAA
jgi:uncharacterized MAPEG superfamily protein